MGGEVQADDSLGQLDRAAVAPLHTRVPVLLPTHL
jgi:hypothetical protein